MTPAEELRTAAKLLRETVEDEFTSWLGSTGVAPDVAEPLAAWLDSAAAQAGKVSDPRNQEIIADQHALRVARVINGGAS